MTELGVSHSFGLVAPLLVGSPHSVRYVFSFAPSPENDDPVVNSTPLRTDFTAFAHLWRSGIAKDPEDEAIRRMDAFSIGQRMGELHNIPAMWIDAHRGQFLTGEPGNALVIDIDGPELWLLYRGPTTAQCATMLVPLLSFFDAPEYTAFRAAYLHERGEAGSDVVNYIEFGYDTGWKRALDRGDYRTVIDLAQAQHDQEAERELNVTLVTLLGMSYSRLALHDKAVAVYETHWGTSIRTAPTCQIFCSVWAKLTIAPGTGRAQQRNSAKLSDASRNSPQRTAAFWMQRC